MLLGGLRGEGGCAALTPWTSATSSQVRSVCFRQRVILVRPFPPSRPHPTETRERDAAATINAHRPRTTGTAQLSDVSCASRRGRGPQPTSPHKPSATTCLPSHRPAVAWVPSDDRPPIVNDAGRNVVQLVLRDHPLAGGLDVPGDVGAHPGCRASATSARSSTPTDENQRDTGARGRGIGAFATSSASVVSAVL